MDEEEPTSVLGDGNAKEVRILDLCCSPGLKLLQMADFFHQIKSGGDCSGGEEHRPVKVVGVDISEHRLNVCKSIVHKFFIDAETSGIAKRDKENPDTINVQLYLQDGTTFGTKSSCDENNLIFDSRVAIDEMIQRGGKRKRMNKSARARERKRLRQIVLEESGSLATEARIGHRQLEANNESNSAKDTRKSIDHFDYVLVDAECSTDGSLKHMKERIKESSSSNSAGNDGQHLEENTMLTDPTKLAELVELQRRLIASGYRLLKDGGTLVYSTCSLSEDQNENVVRWLLQNHEDAFLVPLHFPSVQNTKFVADGSLTGTVRFYPNLLQEGSPSDLLLGDGFFVAKIRKRRK
jgi:16S rRNA C967 or C1407 C5-methylase (RsmB/RsmF family)